MDRHQLQDTLDTTSYDEINTLWLTRMKKSASVFGWMEYDTDGNPMGRIYDMWFYPHDMSIRGWGLDYSSFGNNFDPT